MVAMGPTSGSGTALGSLATASTAASTEATASMAASTGTTSRDLGRSKPQTCDPLSSSDCSDTERVLAKSLCSLFHSLKRKRNVSQGNSAAVVWGANPVTVPEINGQTVTESGRLQSMLATQGMPASPAIPVTHLPANTLPAPVQLTLPPVDVNPLLHTANSAVQIPTQQLGNEVLCGVTSLAHSVPDTIKDKILKREYIDIFSLLVTDMEVEPEKGGSAEAKDKRPKVAKNIQNWIRAFHIFMPVIEEHEPAHAPFLIRYMDTILTAQRRGGWAWFNYDIRFRKSMAHNPAVSWQHRLIDLWLDEMTLQKSSWAERAGTSYSHLRERGLYQRDRFSFQGSGRWDTCRQFNAGHCTWKNCKIRHTCSTCGFGSHPAAQCHTSRDQRQFPQQQVGRSPDFASPNPGPC
ncbi:uncharacterized protein LOC115099388 isoform X1 [Rhinatrema bivittatum]|uniref:uncharacterized protein LOC115098637 n=1 Tax=Rhinatrema bivittatum TaxID=194408 RepID=UPI0011275E3C|nr:uncharacterized protein LOC115098637 [Rhinatrema bivittatum]XP_029472858.1 uncharacterized protein LOC115099388 isoform X1 [Rhinatrema bivittatum]